MAVIIESIVAFKLMRLAHDESTDTIEVSDEHRKQMVELIEKLMKDQKVIVEPVDFNEE